MSTSSLKNRALNGVFWSAIDRFSSQGISFLISIVIARLLTPHDYGLVAMVGIFISIAQAFIDSGLSSAIVRKKDRTTVDLSTAFYANIIIGVLCYAILYLAAPYIARFYQEDELCSIVRIMGIIFFLFSFSNIQQAVLSINIDFPSLCNCFRNSWHHFRIFRIRSLGSSYPANSTCFIKNHSAMDICQLATDWNLFLESILFIILFRI